MEASELGPTWHTYPRNVGGGTSLVVGQISRMVATAGHAAGGRARCPPPVSSVISAAVQLRIPLCARRGESVRVPAGQHESESLSVRWLLCPPPQEPVVPGSPYPKSFMHPVCPLLGGPWASVQHQCPESRGRGGARGCLHPVSAHLWLGFVRLPPPGPSAQSYARPLPTRSPIPREVGARSGRYPCSMLGGHVAGCSPQACSFACSFLIGSRPTDHSPQHNGWGGSTWLLPHLAGFAPPTFAAEVGGLGTRSRLEGSLREKATDSPSPTPHLVTQAPSSALLWFADGSFPGSSPRPVGTPQSLSGAQWKESPL